MQGALDDIEERTLLFLFGNIHQAHGSILVEPEYRIVDQSNSGATLGPNPYRTTFAENGFEGGVRPGPTIFDLGFDLTVYVNEIANQWSTVSTGLTAQQQTSQRQAKNDVCFSKKSGCRGRKYSPGKCR